MKHAMEPVIPANAPVDSELAMCTCGAAERAFDATDNQPAWHRRYCALRFQVSGITSEREGA